MGFIDAMDAIMGTIIITQITVCVKHMVIIPEKALFFNSIYCGN